jgi:hypothetical protein
MPSFSVLSSVVAFLALAFTSFSDSRAQSDFPKSQQTMEVVGFSSNGKLFAVKTKDDEGRHAYQVRTSRKGEIEKVYSFFEGEEKKTWRRVKRVHEITMEPSDSPENEKLGVTLVTAQKGDKLVVFVMKGEKVKRYGAVSLQKARDGKSVATANVGQLVWGPKGKHVVMIYHQKLKKPQPWESDFVHAFKLKRYKVSFDD